ncbi:MAG: deoxyribodipyrimidine photo-lyase [Candidatus Thermoplasmatota archaeon]|nr:deoxyribodipyrimidine photo-lyase [Candidatus Thermoplasmatota archaeon]
MDVKKMIDPTRIKKLNDKTYQENGYIIYWMQASQRSKNNHALEHSIQLSNRYQKPLLVFFGLTEGFPEANLRHYMFMLQGLKELKKSLEQRDIQCIIRRTSPEKGIVSLSKIACLVVVDRGYQRIQRSWRSYVANHIKCPMIQVESDVIVPVEEASDKEEFAAFTLRPKLMKKYIKYAKDLKNNVALKDSFTKKFPSEDINDITSFVSKTTIDPLVKPVEGFIGGEKNAEKRLNEFLKNKIDRYADLKNDPTLEYTSDLSPYLHFGNISPLQIALEVSKTPVHEAFIEELFVRRELSINFVYYNPSYDSYEGIPQWARDTLQDHANDKREYLYELEELEQANTHDPYWNAAQRQMMTTGKMHGYMRMYWGKKIIEWTKRPHDAYQRTLYLNNKYELDGRDPNGFAGVAWCFGKHDRPWKKRPVFGTIRYMNDAGLKRKFDIEAYAKRYG